MLESYFSFCVSHLRKDKIEFSIVGVSFLVSTAIKGTNHFNRTSRADAGFEKGFGIATSQEMNKGGYMYLLEFWKAVRACTMCSFSGSTFHSAIFLICRLILYSNLVVLLYILYR